MSDDERDWRRHSLKRAYERAQRYHSCDRVRERQQQVAAAYAAGKSYRQLAAHFGVSLEQIRRDLRATGTAPRHRNWAKD